MKEFNTTTKRRIQEFFEYSQHIYSDVILRENHVNLDELPFQKSYRIKRLLNDWKSFFKYYFSNDLPGELGAFQIEFVEAVIFSKNTLITRAFPRFHGKTTLIKCCIIYKSLRKLTKFSVYLSKSFDNAEEITRGIKLEFEENLLLINDFGNQKTAKWDDGKFVLKNGAIVKALGRGQSPRGVKEKSKRPDDLYADDIDDRYLIKNSELLDETEKWFFGAFVGTLDPKGNKMVIATNNIIGVDTLFLRIVKRSKNHKTYNILDDKGNITWKEHLNMDDVRFYIDLMKDEAEQELFNNPSNPGDLFQSQWYTYEHIRPDQIQQIICYSILNNQGKRAIACIGYTNTNQYYIIKFIQKRCSIGQFKTMHKNLKKELRRKAMLPEGKKGNTPFGYLDGITDFYIQENEFDLLSFEDFEIYPESEELKHEDIENLSEMFENNKIIFSLTEQESEGFKELKSQLNQYRPGKSQAHLIPCLFALAGAVKLLSDNDISFEPIINKSNKTRW